MRWPEEVRRYASVWLISRALWAVCLKRRPSALPFLLSKVTIGYFPVTAIHDRSATMDVTLWAAGIRRCFRPLRTFRFHIQGVSQQVRQPAFLNFARMATLSHFEY